MLGTYDFCAHYEWTFEWLDKRGGHPLVRDYWEEAISRDSQLHARELIFAEGFEGMLKYWGHTLLEESPDQGYSIKPLPDLVRADMQDCPSKGFLIRNGLEQYRDYCDHCIGWIGPVMKEAGFTVDHEHNHRGQCWWEFRKADDPRGASKPGELYEKDARVQANWAPEGATIDRYERAADPDDKTIHPGRSERAATVTVVAFGDSTTAPRGPLPVYTALLEERFRSVAPSLRFVNRGVGGNTTAMARQRFDHDVLAENPDWVIIQFGINDAAVDVWKTPPESAPRVALAEYVANLRHFIHEVRKAGGNVILMTPNSLRWTPQLRDTYGRPPYDPGSETGFTTLLDDYAQAVRTLANEEEALLLDVHALYGQWEKDHARSCSELLLDGMHPNAEGQQLVADALEPLIRQSVIAAAPGS